MLDFILERLQAAAPELDQNSAQFRREFLDPVRQYLGQDLPRTDIQALLRARLSEEFPMWAGSVLADAFARHAALLALPIYAEIAAARSRLRLDDPRMLSGRDLEEARSTWMVPPQGGQFARGTFRAYFNTPRNITIDTLNLITLPATNRLPERSYRPTQLQTVTTVQMRGSVDGGFYYVDVAVEATVSGPEHNLGLGEGSGATGIPGATRITNTTRIDGGVLADDPRTFLERIRSNNRLRSASTPGGLRNLLGELGVSNYLLVEPGNWRMLRDRVYGVGYVSGIPGGFARDYSEALPALAPYVSLGIAHDVWIPSTLGAQLSTVKISSLRDEGLLMLTGDVGQFAYSGGSPDTTHPITEDALADEPQYKEYILVSRGLAFGLLIDDPELYRAAPVRHGWSMFPLEAGDVVERQGWVDTFTGVRRRMLIASLGTGILTGGQRTIVRVPPSDWGNVSNDLWRWQALRVNADWSDADRMKFAASINPHTSVPWFAVPLNRLRALSPTGTVVQASGQPALTTPGSTTAEVVGGSRVPITSNLIERSAPEPVSWLSRVELLDAVTGQPAAEGTRAYVYPARPLAVEFREPRHGSSAIKGSTPVRVRFHLFGPQALAPSPALTLGIEGTDPDVLSEVPEGYDHVDAGDDYDAPFPGTPRVGKNQWRRFGPYRPLYWPKMAYTATPLDGTAAETGRLVVTLSGGGAALLTTRVLQDFNAQDVFDTGGERLIQPGDWVLMIPRTGAYAWADATVVDSAEWPDPYPQVPDYSDITPGDWYQVCRAWPIVSIDSATTLTVAAADVPTGETGDLWVVQGTSRAVQLAAGRGEEGTYFADVFFARYSNDGDPHVVEHPPLGTLAQFDPLELYIQGFQETGPRPGTYFGASDDVTLLFPTGYVNDGSELDGRSIHLYGPSGAPMQNLDAALTAPEVRAMTNSLMVRQTPPARLTLAIYYTAEDLPAEEAALVVRDALQDVAGSGVLELSDIARDLYAAGADYVSTGRAMLHTVNHLRVSTARLSDASVPLDALADLIPEALCLRRLNTLTRQAALATGTPFVEADPANWIEEAIYRFGDFGED